MNVHEFLSHSTETFSGTASGRMDVMGGIADYSGSLLLQKPISEKTTVHLQKRTDTRFRIATIDAEGKEKRFEWTWNIPADCQLQEAGLMIREQAADDWPVYVVGCFVLLNQKNLWKVSGADLVITTSIPMGKGVSSSAALEIAVLRAAILAWDIELEPLALPLMAQQVENEIVGAACGLMDQLSVCFGRDHHLLPLICQPSEVYAPVPVPNDIHFIGIDSGVRHAVGGSDYRTVRTAAFMAYSVIAHREGASREDILAARQGHHCGSLPFKGFLANISPSEFEQFYAPFLPEQIQGSEFIETYGVTPDHITEVEPGTTYPLLAAARHPVLENYRIQVFLELLLQLNDNNQESILPLMGELMLQSHAGYGSMGLGNERTDEIVALVRNAGVKKKLFGARISGGGSGGTVVVLAQGKEGLASVDEIYNLYENKYPGKQYLFLENLSGSVSLNF